MSVIRGIIIYLVSNLCTSYAIVNITAFVDNETRQYQTQRSKPFSIRIQAKNNSLKFS